MATSTYPNWLAGNRILASQLNAGIPLTIVKPTDESVTSSTTLQNDNDLLTGTLPAGAEYEFRCYLDYEGGTQGSSDLKLQWAVPAGANLRYQPIGGGTGGGALTSATNTDATILQVGTSGAGNLHGVTMIGSFTMGGTAGPLQLKWAQNTINASPTIVHAQSSLKLIRTQ